MQTGGTGQFSSWARSKLKEYMDRIKKMEKEAFEAADKKAKKDLSSYIQREVPPIYIKTITDFYRDYNPKFYDRTWSLYDLLEIKEKNGVVDSLEFDPTKMTQFRKEERTNPDDLRDSGLYAYVFKQGWHGGASKHGGDSYSGEEDDIGMYKFWRKPFPSFKLWGREADVAATSPYWAFVHKMDEETAPGGKFYDYYVDTLKKYFSEEFKKRMEVG